MREGFYKEADILTPDNPFRNFSFLEKIETDYYMNAWDFLHGYCVTFAYIVSKNLGYPIVIRRLSEPECNGESDVIHAWCETDRKYIDVRGITENFGKFWEEFEDFDSFDLEDDDYETFRFQNAKDFYKFLDGNQNPETFGMNRLKAAQELFDVYKDYYIA